MITLSKITRAAHLWHAQRHGLHHPNKDHRNFFSRRSEAVQFRSCPSSDSAEREISRQVPQLHAVVQYQIVAAELQNHVQPQCSGRFQRLSDTQTTCRVGIARYSRRFPDDTRHERWIVQDVGDQRTLHSPGLTVYSFVMMNFRPKKHFKKKVMILKDAKAKQQIWNRDRKICKRK